MKKPMYSLAPLIFASIFPLMLWSQDESTFQVKASGFVWTETFYDSRQTVSSHERALLLFPAPYKADALGRDINDSPNFSILSIHARSRLRIQAPDFWGAKVSSLVEADFAGNTQGRYGLLRLRHAMIKLNWEKSELLFGQYHHPMFTPESFPQTVSWGAAVPYHPLSRNPQIRFSYLPSEHSKFSLAINTQLDFKSPGPDGASAKYQQNAGLPEVNASYMIGRQSNVLAGITAGYKLLKPAQTYTLGGEEYKCIETLGSYHLNAFTKIKWHKHTLRAGAIYGENLYNFVMLGGYGMSACNAEGESTYSALTTGAYWFDWTSPTIKEQFQLGLYAGYTQNYGADTPITGDVYGRGTNIHHAYRLAPRLIYGTGPLRFRLETTFDQAAYGSPDDYFRVQDTATVENVRMLLAVTLNW